MSNLLPIPEQRRVWAIYRSRFIIALSTLLIALALLAALALLPSYLALEIAAPPESDAKIAHAANTPDPTGLARAQTIVRTLSPALTSTSSPTSLIEAVLAAKPSGVAVTQITYSMLSGSQLSLTGSGNRDKVSAYRDALAKNPSFTSVSIPVSALVGSGEGRFSLTIGGSF